MNNRTDLEKSIKHLLGCLDDCETARQAAPIQKEIAQLRAKLGRLPVATPAPVVAGIYPGGVCSCGCGSRVECSAP